MPDFEIEYTPDELQADSVWILDGRGQMIKKEVDDDAGDD